MLFVVFGVTLRLLVINISSSSSANNKRRRLPAMTVTNLPQSGAAVRITLGGRTVKNTRWSQILHPKAPLGGSPSEYCQKLKWCGYPRVKNWRYIYSFRQNTRTWRTDRRKDTVRRHRPRFSIVRQNKEKKLREVHRVGNGRPITAAV